MQSDDGRRFILKGYASGYKQQQPLSVTGKLKGSYDFMCVCVCVCVEREVVWVLDVCVSPLALWQVNEDTVEAGGVQMACDKRTKKKCWTPAQNLNDSRVHSHTHTHTPNQPNKQRTDTHKHISTLKHIHTGTQPHTHTKSTLGHDFSQSWTDCIHTHTESKVDTGPKTLEE